MTSTTRRTFIAAGLATAAAAPFGWSGPAGAAVQLRLPRPTGPFSLGTVPLHLDDRVRGRELMISVWYPADHADRYPRAPWMLAAPLRELLVSADFDAGVAASPLTAAHAGAPVRRSGQGRPVVLFSHGAHDHRAGNTITVQELTSHGYVVVTVDHLGDAFSQLPDGRVMVPTDALGPQVFADDVRFVLDQLEVIATGHNPDVDRHPLPAGLARALDLRRVGMFGWSKGGTATARVMLADRRVRAGISLDGPMLPTVAGRLDRPFLMVTAEMTRAAEPSVAAFWDQLHGWRRNIRAEGAIHGSYGDYQVLIPQLARATGMSREELRGWIGTLDPARALRIQQAYPLAFFDRHLRHRPGHLLDGPSPAFPDVRFIP